MNRVTCTLPGCFGSRTVRLRIRLHFRGNYLTLPIVYCCGRRTLSDLGRREFTHGQRFRNVLRGILHAKCAVSGSRRLRPLPEWSRRNRMQLLSRAKATRLRQPLKGPSRAGTVARCQPSQGQEERSPTTMQGLSRGPVRNGSVAFAISRVVSVKVAFKIYQTINSVYKSISRRRY